MDRLGPDQRLSPETWSSCGPPDLLRFDVVMDRILEEPLKGDAQLRSGVFDERKEFAREVRAEQFSAVRSGPYACDGPGCQAAAGRGFGLRGRDGAATLACDLMLVSFHRLPFVGSLCPWRRSLRCQGRLVDSPAPGPSGAF